MTDIFYKPDLEVERSYYSDGTIPNKEEQIISDDDNKTSDIFEDINNKIKKLRSVSRTMPSDIANVFDGLLANAEYLYDLIDKDTYDPDMSIDDSDIIISDEDSLDSHENPDDSLPYDNGTDDDFNIFSISILDTMQIKVPIIDLEKFVDNNYYGDILAVLENYLFKMQDAASRYMASILSIASETNIKDLGILTSEYINSSKNIKDKNLVHLSDSIIRSTIVRNQKLKLLKKLNNLRETSLHVKSCKAASDFRGRYVAEKYTDPSDMLDLYNNALLSEAISSYEKKYEENFRNLYKYMNSSVILINECLMTFLKEAQGKAILINKGEIKL